LSRRRNALRLRFDADGSLPLQRARPRNRLRYNAGVARTRRPKLGQHFLISDSYRRRIVEALHLQPDDLIIEIGPGRGAMTTLLAGRARQVVAIELDRLLAEGLKRHVQEKNVEILSGDILATDLATLCRRHRVERCFVFGNLPYYITSPILHGLFAFAPWIRGIALLVQREVAERLTARPGSRDYGYLSVLVQFHSQPHVVMIVPPGAFSPPPRVQSALVEFKMGSRQPGWPETQRKRFFEFVKNCFAQKRKNLLNNLARKYGRERVLGVLGGLQLAATARAEEMAVEPFITLFKSLVPNLPSGKCAAGKRRATLSPIATSSAAKDVAGDG
jgi:16S rRNA (adenine1518-N6/adenine1519-N6)-dimethyltransferase